MTLPTLKATKPHGGFRFLTIQQLCLLWWAYRTSCIQLIDFRVWYAAQEMVARRCQLAPDHVPDYTHRELHGLVGGVGGEHLRASLRRLAALGLLTWSRTQLTFATSLTDLCGRHDLAGFHTMVDAIPNAQRRVPVPRQALRLIAGGRKASVIATMLGHLLRCLYYREQRCHSGGWCKASWIAEVFGIHLRSVKAARKYLVEIGWLRTFHASQRMGNRWGTYTLISLSWTRTALERHTDAHAGPPASQSPPPSKFCTTGLPPLLQKDREPFQESQHQQPTLTAETTRAALPLYPPALLSHEKTGVKIRDTHTRKAPPFPPTLQHIVSDDLCDTARLLILFAQAQRQGLIDGSDSARLTFVAMAEHARGLGTANPCGLFAALVRRQCWHYVTDRDEDAASVRLKQYWYGSEEPRLPTCPPRAAAPPPLSKDAFMVRELQRELARAGFQGEAFGWVHRAYPEWTRARWDAAVTELTAAQLGWQRANASTCLEECAQASDTTWAA